MTFFNEVAILLLGIGRFEGLFYWLNVEYNRARLGDLISLRLFGGI